MIFSIDISLLCFKKPAVNLPTAESQSQCGVIERDCNCHFSYENAEIYFSFSLFFIFFFLLFSKSMWLKSDAKLSVYITM